jgi:hypothetical protein
MEYFDLRVILGTVSIHLRVYSKELSTKTVESFKLEMIFLFKDSIANFLTSLDDTEDADAILLKKCVFSRDKMNYQYKLLSHGEEQELDMHTYDIVFVITEGIITDLEALSETVLAAFDKPVKFCLVYISDESVLPKDFTSQYYKSTFPNTNVNVDREFWCIEEDLVLGPTIGRFQNYVIDELFHMAPHPHSPQVRTFNQPSYHT